MRPGVNVTTRESAPPSVIPTDVGVGFMVNPTEAGPGFPTTNDSTSNMDEWAAKYAPSGRGYAPGILAYDSAEQFFNEGGSRLFTGRVSGPAAAPAIGALNDNAAAVALNASARGDGEWGNDLSIVVTTTAQNPDIAANAFRIQIKSVTTSKLLEESYDLADNAAAIAWATGSSYISLAGGASALDPAPTTTNLSGGTNDISNITSTDWQGGFDSLSIELGPGVVFAPGATSDALHQMAANHALTNGRVAFLDGPDTATAATLIASAKAVTDSTQKRARFAGMFAPWAIVSGLTANTVRKVPPSPLVAGAFCRNMAAGLAANDPAAGDNGVLKTVLAMTQNYTDADREKMNSNGVDIIRDVYGVFKVYGWRSTADPVADRGWIDLGNSLLHRQIVAQANAVGERFVFKKLDGKRRLVSQFGGALDGEVCMPLFQDGSLYGEDPMDAYKVDVGTNVNTDETIENLELHAIISVRMSPFGEEVDIEIVKYMITESIPA